MNTDFWRKESFLIPLGLFGLAVLSYGILSPWLGFYWDDWPTIWFARNFGPGGFLEVFAEDRPLLALPFMVTTPIFGQSTFAWQVFGILVRWVCTLSFWWLVRLVFPREKHAAILAAVIFLIYPGFRQQYIAVTYSHAFIYYTLFLLSLGTMVLAVKRKKWFIPLYLFSVISEY